MKLYYYKLPGNMQNFGDALNPWLWSRLLPDEINEDASQVFIGVGTLLNERLLSKVKEARKKIIFSSGVGYGSRPLVLDTSFHIYGVRGPLSAAALGLPRSLAVTDGAYLIRKLYQSYQPKHYRFSYMPHYELAGQAWENVCKSLGFGYIDPRESVEQVMEKIDQTEILLTEAMHGAIVADALRIPWIPIVTHDSILAFKWHDWCQSVGLDYQPYRLARLQDISLKKDVLSPLRLVRDYGRQRQAIASLKAVIKVARPQLSDGAVMANLTDKLYDKLDCFKQDLAAGMFD